MQQRALDTRALYLTSLPALPIDTMDAGLPGTFWSSWAKSARGERRPPKEKLPNPRRCACGDVFPAAKVSFRAWSLGRACMKYGQPVTGKTR